MTGKCILCEDPKIDFYGIMKHYCSDIKKIKAEICEIHKQPLAEMAGGFLENVKPAEDLGKITSVKFCVPLTMMKGLKGKQLDKAIKKMVGVPFKDQNGKYIGVVISAKLDGKVIQVMAKMDDQSVPKPPHVSPAIYKTRQCGVCSGLGKVFQPASRLVSPGDMICTACNGSGEVEDA